MFVLLFLVGRLLFQRRSRTENCSHAAAGIPNVSHGNVRNEKTESYGIWRNENSEQNAVPAAVWGIFHNFAFPKLPKNKRTECSWGRCSADLVATCYLHSSSRTWWLQQGANTSVVASRWCRLPVASCNAKSRQLHTPHLVILLVASTVATSAPAHACKFYLKCLMRLMFCLNNRLALCKCRHWNCTQFLQIQAAFLSGHGKGRKTFLTVVCYLTKNENTDILVNPGSADPVSGAVNLFRWPTRKHT